MRPMIATYFRRLMEAGLMQVAEPTFAAREYHSFFIYAFYENTLTLGLREPDALAAGQAAEHGICPAGAIQSGYAAKDFKSKGQGEVWDAVF